MSATTEARLADAEAHLERLETRVRQLEGWSAGREPLPRSTRAESALAPHFDLGARDLVLPRPRLDLEELLGGRVLAIVGGIAILVGLAFFVALAVDHGWVGEVARVAIAFAGSALLAAGGVYAAECRGHRQAALAAAGTGLAGLFLSLAAATLHYGLVSNLAGYPVALAVGAAAVVLAVRWSSRSLAALGLVGSLLAPVSTGGDLSGGAMAYLTLALAAAAAVLVWRRWEWLRIMVFAVVVPQAAAWIYLDEPATGAVALVLAVVVALVLVAALGYELRVPSAALRPSTSLLVALNALFAAGVGGIAIHGEAGPQAAGLWVAGVAAAYAALGLAGIVSRRVASDICVVMLGASLVAANVAASLLVSGASLAIVWAASAAALAGIARRATGREELLHVALGGQLALATVHTLLVDAPLGAQAGESGGLGAALSATAAVAIGALACARLTRSERHGVRTALDAVAIAALAYLTGLALDGTPLVLAWAAEAAALSELGRRTGDPVARRGALAFLALGAGHVVAFEATTDGLLYGVPDLGSVALSLGGLAFAGFQAWRAWPASSARARLLVLAATGIGVLYLCSLGIIDVFQPDGRMLATGLDVDVRQQGQAALSTFWALAGLGVLWAGLVRRMRNLRLAGFGLLLLVAGKVFLYDLSTLASAWRVLSLVALGLLLLAAASLYQRARRDTAEPGAA
jgi:uncharacterized membrane protein